MQEAASSVADCGGQVLALDFHPSLDIAAASLITGSVQLWRYSIATEDGRSASAASGPELALSLSHHTESCREVRFSSDGAWLYSGGTDCSLCAVDTNGTLVWRQEEAHETAVNCLFCGLGPQMLVSGDEDGAIKVWDLRLQKCVAACHEQTDFVADLAFHEQQQRLLCTSGDGTLGVYDLRRGRIVLEHRSDEQEDELLSLQILKDGRKVVVGTQEGVLAIWSWGDWGDLSDRFPGHPESIETMLKIDEDTICTGSSDGLIRIVSIHPNKLLGVVGDHEDFPVECIRFSHDRRLLGSSSHDSLVRFWDVSYLNDEGDENDDEEGQMDEDAIAETNASSGKRKAGMKPPSQKEQAESFFSDL